MQIEKAQVRGTDKELYPCPFWVAGHAHLKEFKPHNAKVPFLMKWLKWQPQGKNVSVITVVN